VAARRYQKKYRNQLWHSDLKYGPYLPIGPNGKKKQVYLAACVCIQTQAVIKSNFGVN